MVPLFSSFVQTAHAALGGIDPVGGPTTGGTNPVTVVNSLYTEALTVITVAAGAIAVLYILWAGIQYITSAGSPDKAKAARSAIINGVIGVVIIVAAYWIIKIGILVGKELSSASGTAGTATTAAGTTTNISVALQAGEIHTATEAETIITPQSGTLTRKDGTTQTFAAGDSITLAAGDSISFDKAGTISVPDPVQNPTTHDETCAKIKDDPVHKARYDAWCTTDLSNRLPQPGSTDPAQTTSSLVSVSVLAYDESASTYIGGANISVGGTSLVSAAQPNTQPIQLSANKEVSLTFKDPKGRYGNCSNLISSDRDTVIVILRTSTSSTKTDVCKLEFRNDAGSTSSTDNGSGY